MSVETIILELPERTYEQIRRTADTLHRPVADVIAEAVTVIVPMLDSVPEPLRAALAQMAYLDDATLLQAARSTLPLDKREQLEALHDKQQREGLTDEEKLVEAALLRRYTEVVLTRAHAAVLLKFRGYDVSNPEKFAPLG